MSMPDNGDGPPPEEQKPMVTLEEYDRARAVLDVLPPGYYVKCGGPCNGWYTGGTFVKAYGGPPYCERCVK